MPLIVNLLALYGIGCLANHLADLAKSFVAKIKQKKQKQLDKKEGK